jgi:alpha-L-glutamate ligase-like protein
MSNTAEQALQKTPHKKTQILGMNRRNSDFLLPWNPRQLYPLVDNKLQTKKLLEANAIPTPQLYFEFHYEHQIKRLRALKNLKEFAIKPACGAEGRGIVVIVNRDEEKGTWEKASGEIISRDDIEYHISNILAGLYSLGGIRDHAFLEYCVHSHPAFCQVTYHGVPDIRTIIYRGVPIMAMLRLPTKQSDGKANLHQGAIGVGINMNEGITEHAVHKNKYIECHPDTKASVFGIKIPFWHEILNIAVKIPDIFKLGYMGADFVIDATLGPLILELNARPGLSIQLANRTGLLSRLKAVDAYGRGVETFSHEKRLALSREISML